MERSDPMNMFSGKRTAKIVRADTSKVTEWSEQLIFCKWLKHEYPDVLFRSDIQNQGKRSPQMQNIMQIVDPYREGMPDVWVYKTIIRCNEVIYNGLAIELKRIGASINTEHGRNQSEMHRKLEIEGWKCAFAFGAEDAKRVFLEYINS